MRACTCGRRGWLGAFVWAIAMAGAGAHAADRLFVSVFSDNRVRRFSAASWEEGPSIGPGTGLISPLGAVIGPDGALYVTSEGTDQVLRVHRDTGALLNVFIGDDPGTPMVDESGGLDNPAAIVFGPDGDAYVASFETDSVLKYDGLTGGFLSVFVPTGSGGLNGPDAGMIFDPNGDLLVPSFFSHAILRYRGSDGVFLGAFVAAGDGGLTNPRALLFRPSDGNLLVTSEGSDRVLLFHGTTGAFLETFIPAIESPSGIALGFDGNVYVASVNAGTVGRYHAATGNLLGTVIENLNDPVHLFFAPDGTPDFSAQEQFGRHFTLSIAWGDSDTDGDPDLAVAVQGEVSNRLYVNNGNGTFTGQNRFGTGNAFAAVWGDYDNDGDADVAVGRPNDLGNHLYVNVGNGAFVEQAQFGASRTVGLAWGDSDNDGDLDLAVGNGILGISRQNFLYVNNGDGTFTGQPQFGMGQTDSVAWGDFDNDGDLDLAVGNGGFAGAGQNYLYINNGNGTFTEREEFGTGDTAAVAWGDANNDGYLDLAVGNWEAGRCYLYVNNLDGTFSQTEQFGDRDTNTVNWADFDNDGDLDLAVGNGNFTSADQNYLYVNQGDGTFLESAQFGLGSTDGVAWADYDGDGDQDLAVGNEHSPLINYLYTNHEDDNDYLTLHVVGHFHDLGAGYSNRDGIGARLWAYAAGHLDEDAHLLGFRQVEAKGGFSSQNFVDVAFGFPNRSSVDIRIGWPGSAGQSIVQDFRSVPVGRRVTVHEQACAPAIDCNANGVDDVCDLMAHVSSDCNANTIPDECDIASLASEDCTANGIPDECEPDCNGNTVADSCDILDGTSEDCAGEGIPDDCEPDCNGNTTADSCDILSGSSGDCNDNRVPDSCDITSGASRDLNNNGIPDDCEPCAPPLPAQRESGAMNKNRYLSFVGGNPARRTAIRVKFLNLPPPFHVWNNAVLWAGTPREVSEQSGLTNATPPVFTAAALGCTPHYEDWSLRGTVNVYHAGIVPRGRYAVQVIDEECVVSEANFSAVLELSSSAWADVAGPFNIATRSWRPPDGRVDVTVDVVAVLEKFRNSLTAPIKARADLEPATADQQVNISDVTRGLDSFRSLPFPFAPGGASPCP